MAVRGPGTSGLACLRRRSHRGVPPTPCRKPSGGISVVKTAVGDQAGLVLRCLAGLERILSETRTREVRDRTKVV